MAERVFNALGGKALQYSRKLSWLIGTKGVSFWANDAHVAA